MRVPNLLVLWSTLVAFLACSSTASLLHIFVCYTLPGCPCHLVQHAETHLKREAWKQEFAGLHPPLLLKSRSIYLVGGHWRKPCTFWCISGEIKRVEKLNVGESSYEALPILRLYEKLHFFLQSQKYWTCSSWHDTASWMCCKGLHGQNYTRLMVSAYTPHYWSPNTHSKSSWWSSCVGKNATPLMCTIHKSFKTGPCVDKKLRTFLLLEGGRPQ